ncbi:RNA polymerase sigma factor [Fulvivirgaceae bacterium BMA10]|uniref:RNA polymerase sigma factor n=1 Tax=Splendidivirga corallicola TaxID=3051826 RepID=A0ABT8KV53_9BACT|nr:RNA polymerase sigma factor [Fulvivirgaceae bacterium BMA10]
MENKRKIAESGSFEKTEFLKEAIKALDKKEFEQIGNTELWKLLKDGNEQAISYVYDKYIYDLFWFGSQFISDKDLVKDCIQDVFTSLVGSQKSSQHVTFIKAYLYKALYRTIMSRIQKEKKYYQAREIIRKTEGFEVVISTEVRMINDEHYNRRIKLINRELGNLSKRQKQAILHYFYDGFTLDEIAVAMEIKGKNSVSKLIRRGLDAIRNNITSLALMILLVLD